MATAEAEAPQTTDPEAPEEPLEPATPDEDGPADDDADDTQEPDTEQPETPEPVPETPPASNEALQEELFAAAGRKAKSYMKGIPDVLGQSAADLLLCPRCTDLLPGWILPLSIKPVSDEQKIAVKQSIGELVEPSYRQDAHSSTCQDCDGEGKVATGSHVQKWKVAVCKACDGRGWVGPRATSLPPEAPAPAVGPLGPLDVDGTEQPLQDPWGRLRDDPLYGVMPGFER
jgi:hypothetical protein